MSYSFGYGRYYFIVLQHSPRYEAREIGIAGSMGWLARELAMSTAAGRRVVLLLHAHKELQLAYDPTFSRLVENSNVVAIFYGHVHIRPWGLVGRYPNTSVPMYNCGAAWYNVYCLAEFGEDSMRVGAVAHYGDAVPTWFGTSLHSLPRGQRGKPVLEVFVPNPNVTTWVGGVRVAAVDTFLGGVVCHGSCRVWDVQQLGWHDRQLPIQREAVVLGLRVQGGQPKHVVVDLAFIQATHLLIASTSTISCRNALVTAHSGSQRPRTPRPARTRSPMTRRHQAAAAGRSCPQARPQAAAAAATAMAVVAVRGPAPRASGLSRGDGSSRRAVGRGCHGRCTCEGRCWSDIVRTALAVLEDLHVSTCIERAAICTIDFDSAGCHRVTPQLPRKNLPRDQRRTLCIGLLSTVALQLLLVLLLATEP
jgi:hypothetical protein